MKITIKVEDIPEDSKLYKSIKDNNFCMEANNVKPDTLLMSKEWGDVYTDTHNQLHVSSEKVTVEFYTMNF